jgi:hypothetical protein
MPLPKELTTVTPLSKGLALSMFIFIPFVAFIVGVNYGESIIMGQTTKATLGPKLLSTPTATPTPLLSGSIKADAKNWTPATISLYKLSLELPVGWTLQEINKRPEPTGAFDPTKGHDCADYQIKSADSLTLISLKPTCGYAEGSPHVWPADAVVIKHAPGFHSIIRFVGSNPSTYIYANTDETQYSDVQGNGKKERSQSQVLSFGNSEDFVILDAHLYYSGPAAQKEKNLALADQLIASIERN